MAETSMFHQGPFLESPGSYHFRKAVFVWRFYIQDVDIKSFEIHTKNISEKETE